MAKALLLLIILVAMVVAARWFLPIGPARALSGELLEVGRQRTTLYGIETGGSDQMCGTTPCGALARQTLDDLIAGRYVLCLPYDLSAAGVFRGVCWAGDTELNEAMVRSGLASVKSDETATYGDAERAAREKGRGRWNPQTPARAPDRQGRVPLITSPP